jgi:hypothetical protein
MTRDPSPSEAVRLSRLYDELAAMCRANPEAAAKLIGPAKPAGADSAETAAWVAVARAIMNLDEFVTRE